MEMVSLGMDRSDPSKEGVAISATSINGLGCNLVRAVLVSIYCGMKLTLVNSALTWIVLGWNE